MENNIEKKIKFYALYDKEINVYDGIVMGFDDKVTMSYYLEQFKNILVSLKDNDRDKFMEKLHNSIIYCVGSFNDVSGDFVNEKTYLADLSSLDIDDIINNKIKEKESEEIKDA